MPQYLIWTIMKEYHCSCIIIYCVADLRAKIVHDLQKTAGWMYGSFGYIYNDGGYKRKHTEV